MNYLNIFYQDDQRYNGEVFLWKILANLCHNKICIDVGAGDANEETVGNFVSAFEKNALKIILFDPRKDKNWTNLLKYTKNKPHVICENVGLVDENKLINTYDYNNHRWIGDNVSPFQGITLESYCHANNIREIGFIKLDIEGFELHALKGGKHIIQNNTDYIQIEHSMDILNAMGISVNEINDFFTNWYIYLIMPTYLTKLDKIPNNIRHCNLLLAKHPINDNLILVKHMYTN